MDEPALTCKVAASVAWFGALVGVVIFLTVEELWRRAQSR